MTAQPAQTFDEVFPVVQKYAALRIRCCDKRAIAVVLAWHYFSTSLNRLPASVWAQAGVRAALAGRDLPGVQSQSRDAMKHMETQGAGMGNVVDRRPGPEREMISREEAEKFWGSLTEFETEMCELLADGMPNHEVARRMRRTQGAISQRRRQLMERCRDQ